MVNILIIARKELSDLLTDGMVVLVLGVYFIYLSVCLYQLFILLSSGQLSDSSDLLYNSNIGVYCSEYIYLMVSDFTLFIGIIIGCASISNELNKYALNTLVIKPVYRDTIINGKLVGTLSFILFINVFTVIVYTAGILILFGNMFTPYIEDYLGRSIIMFAVIIIATTIFMSLSMLVSILVRNQAFSIMIAVILLFCSRSVSVFSNFFDNGMGKVITSLTPYGLRDLISYNMFRPSITIIDALNRSESYIIGLILFLISSLVLCYIVFMRRDIT